MGRRRELCGGCAPRNAGSLRWRNDWNASRCFSQKPHCNIFGPDCYRQRRLEPTRFPLPQQCSPVQQRFLGAAGPCNRPSGSHSTAKAPERQGAVCSWALVSLRRHLTAPVRRSANDRSSLDLAWAPAVYRTFHRLGASPSGKAPDFDSGIRRFESSRPSHPTLLRSYGWLTPCQILESAAA